MMHYHLHSNHISNSVVQFKALKLECFAFLFPYFWNHLSNNIVSFQWNRLWRIYLMSICHQLGCFDAVLNGPHMKRLCYSVLHNGSDTLGHLFSVLCWWCTPWKGSAMIVSSKKIRPVCLYVVASRAAWRWYCPGAYWTSLILTAF